MGFSSAFRRAKRRAYMSYQVIARKYRPQRFRDVVGQEHVTQTLARALEQKRIAHAYLFCGPRGTGKTTIARIFAKCLNCEGGPRVEFAEDDPRCREIAEGRSLDVFEIDGASNNGVEQVRELRETCKYAPASSRFKIYIIDEVHRLSTGAFNALLKTLEEPPAHVKFMFATTDPEKVLPTILSRCQRFDLRRIPTALIAQHLAHIADLEKVQVAPAALHAIARGAEGAMRDAESALDQLISFCGGRIEEADVLSMFGLTAQGQLLELTRMVLAGEVETALRLLNDLANHGKDLRRLLSDLLNHFRNLLIFQVSRGELDMLEVSEAEAAELKEQSPMAGADALTRIMEVFAEAERQLRDAASKKILVEVALLRAIEARAAVRVDTLLQQLQSLRGPAETRPAPAGAAPPSHFAPEPSASAGSPKPAAGGKRRAPDAAAEAEPAGTAAAAEELPGVAPGSPRRTGDLGGLWSGLLEAVGRASQFIRSYLLGAHPVAFAENVLTIGYDPEFGDHLGLVDTPRTHALLQTKLAELGHPNVQIKFIQTEALASPALPPDTASPPPAVSATARRTAVKPAASAANKPEAVPFSQEDFKNDPLIQKALEIFKGRIVEVRA